MGGADDLLAVLRALEQKGHAQGKSGTVSVRETRGIVVKPTGILTDQLRVEDFPLVDPQGKVLEGKREPTGKLPLHLAIYAGRPDVRAIVHGHPAHATALAAVRRDLPLIPDDLLGLVGGTVRCSSYHPVGTPEWAKAGVEALGDRAAALLASHGLVAVGRTPRDALEVFLLIESAARMHILTQDMGGAKAIPEEALRRYRNEYVVGRGMR